MREDCEWQVCYRVTCRYYERKVCIHGGKEKVKEQYSPANINVWIRDAAVKSA